MISEKDKRYLSNPNYSMALEKFFSRDLDLPYYNQQHDIYRRDKNVGFNFAIETVYPFTNENLFQLFSQINVKNKTIATTGSSGDQILAALLFGAKKVTLIDGNIYAKHFIDYKFAAIKNLSFEEFKTNFIDHKNYFDFNIFKRISHDLPPDSFAFWGTIYSHTDNALKIRIKIANSNNQRPKTDFLYNKETYETLQKVLTEQKFKLNFVIAEFNDFPNKLKCKYDAILLSNIFQYVNKDDYVRVITKLQEKLKPSGKIQLNYDFPAPFNKVKPDQTEAFENAFKTDENKVYSIQFEQDRIYILEKLEQKQPSFQ